MDHFPEVADQGVESACAKQKCVFRSVTIEDMMSPHPLAEERSPEESILCYPNSILTLSELVANFQGLVLDFIEAKFCWNDGSSLEK